MTTTPAPEDSPLTDREVIDRERACSELFASQTRHADAKAGYVGAVVGLVVSGILSNLDLVEATLLSGGSLVAKALLAALGAALLGALVWLTMTVIPRAQAPSDANILAFSAESAGDVSARFQERRSAANAWSACAQSAALALITKAKMLAVRRAMIWTAASAVAFVGWIVSASLL